VASVRGMGVEVAIVVGGGGLEVVELLVQASRTLRGLNSEFKVEAGSGSGSGARR